VLPTLVPQVLTPAPTNTPAPTPTPAVHIVQPGDTLLGIALQYNVTLEELYQVNGVLKPELLQIGQSIVIPVPGSVGKPAGDNTGAVIAPTQPPQPVQVEHAARYQTPVGSSWVLGEVFNSTDQPIENVQVRVALLDAAGQEVASEAGVGVGPVITRPLQPIAPPARTHTHNQPRHIRRHRRWKDDFIAAHLPDLRAKLYHAICRD